MGNNISGPSTFWQSLARDFDQTYLSVGRSVNMESARGERIFMAGRTSINLFLINLSLFLPPSHNIGTSFRATA